MPNWCENNIVITGDKEKMKPIFDILNRIKDLSGEDGYVMQNLIGLDDALHKEVGWYDHNIERYGTKWDFTLENYACNIGDECISINNSTAWSPPINFLIHLCNKYDVSANIQYFEPGVDYSGDAEISKDFCEDTEYDSYLEGCYILDNGFDEEIRNWIEGYFDEHENPDFDKFMSEYCPFIGDDDERGKQSVKLTWDEVKEELDEQD